MPFVSAPTKLDTKVDTSGLLYVLLQINEKCFFFVYSIYNNALDLSLSITSLKSKTII